jgi:cytochrome c556
MKFALLIGVLTAGFGAGALRAGEKPPADYVASMKTAGVAAGAMRQAIEAGDFAKVSSAAAELKTVLAKTEAFWAARKSDDGVMLSRQGQKAADDLEAAATAKDTARVTAASQALTASCGGCHTAHRERIADGTFEIK